MIKGRYVCQIEADFEYDSKSLKIGYPELRDRVTGEWLKKMIGEAVKDIFFSGNPKIKVTKQYADVYEVKE